MTDQAGSPSASVSGLTISNNVMYDRKAGAGGAVTFLHIGAFVENLTIEFNTFFGIEDESALGINASAGSNNIIVRNNIFSLSDAFPAISSLSATATSNLAMDYNLYDVVNDVFEDSDSTGYADITALQVDFASFEVNGVEGDTLFVSEAGRDFHLQASSPAEGAGVATSTTVDYDDVARGTPPDIGAFQFAAAPAGCAAGVFNLNIDGSEYVICPVN